MNYIDTLTKAYPLSERDIINLNPNTSFATPFEAPVGYAFVFPAPPPTYDALTQRAQEETPVFTTKGTWEQQWTIVEMYETQEERDVAIAAALKSRVPTSISMRQAELALLAAGLLDDVEALIPSLPRADQIAWKRATLVERSNPLVAYVQQVNGLTDLQLDELFTRAASL